MALRRAGKKNVSKDGASQGFLDTIAAISTPPGEGGIGIVRLSGPEALAIASRIFVPRRPRDLRQSPGFRMYLGMIVDGAGGRPVDEVLVSVMRAPRSYTGEDVVEINCHGGMVPVRRTLELVLREGARLAGPGEFTRRAFLHGRIDLAQAEAVLDVIRARTRAGLELAVRQIEGKLSRRIQEAEQELIGIMASLEASIDFPLEVDEPEGGELLRRLADLRAQLEELIRGSSQGRILREGIKVAIVGRPNVGKSSLLNGLLGEERAIVTEVPGTTRDLISEAANIRGIPVELVDTAGIRETADLVEQLGVERSRQALAQADVVLLVVDGSQGADAADAQLAAAVGDRPGILVYNKMDLVGGDKPEAGDWLPSGWRQVYTSAKEGWGLEELQAMIAEMVLGGEVSPGTEVLVTRARHQAALEKAVRALEQGEETVQAKLPLDLLAVDLRAAREALGEITGSTVDEEVLDRIFQDFCVGK